MVSPIYRPNIMVGAMEGIPQNESPLDFFNLDHWKFGDSKSVNFLEAFLEAGDCLYVPAYYYYQS